MRAACPFPCGFAPGTILEGCPAPLQVGEANAGEQEAPAARSGQILLPHWQTAAGLAAVATQADAVFGQYRGEVRLRLLGSRGGERLAPCDPRHAKDAAHKAGLDQQGGAPVFWV